MTFLPFYKSLLRIEVYLSSVAADPEDFPWIGYVYKKKKIPSSEAWRHFRWDPFRKDNMTSRLMN